VTDVATVIRTTYNLHQWHGLTIRGILIILR